MTLTATHPSMPAGAVAAARRPGLAAALRWEIVKLAAQVRSRALLAAALVIPVVVVAVLNGQEQPPSDTIYGKLIHLSGYAMPLLMLAFAAQWVEPATPVPGPSPPQRVATPSDDLVGREATVELTIQLSGHLWIAGGERVRHRQLLARTVGTTSASVGPIDDCRLPDMVGPLIAPPPVLLVAESDDLICRLVVAMRI